ncbi:MFS transporter [Acetobacteraceae bacterium H6797]|nr:MFS transporter [Acetobacteraceae bacterium H6797]
MSTRNARVFFSASLVSWTGLWMHRVAVSWLAWELTGSAFWVGMAAFCDLVPAVFFSPIAGAVADRVDRVRLTMLSQALIGLEAAAVATLTACDAINIGILLTLEFLNGINASFAQPARQAMMPGLVPKGELPAAVACNSLLFNVARFFGPGLAGPIIALYGVVPAIACNAIAYTLACISGLFLVVDPEARQGHKASNSLFGEVAEGVVYVARHPGLGPMLAFASVTAILLRGVQEILPPFVERVFGRGAESLALLTSCFAVGALVSGFIVAQRGRVTGASRIAVYSILAQAAAIALFVATDVFAVGMVAAVLIGATASAHGISVQQLAQHASSPAMRGRIISLWGLISRGGPAIGALGLGALGEVFGLRWPTMLGAFLSLFAIAWGIRRLSTMQRNLEG